MCFLLLGQQHLKKDLESIVNGQWNEKWKLLEILTADYLKDLF